MKLSSLLSPTKIKNWFRIHTFSPATPDTVKGISKAFAIADANCLSGDYYEFGLYKGFVFSYAHKISKDSNTRFFGFDSFEGLPEVEGTDAGAKFRKGQYACSLEQVKKNIRSVATDKTFLIPGFYEDTLLRKLPYSFGKAKVVLIDCDLYSSTVLVLNFIRPFLQQGTIILFDDWNCFNASDDRGERRATQEFLQRNPHISLTHLGTFGWHGEYFLVNIAAGSAQVDT